MKSFISKFNATKKLSVTSALFSLLFLFCSSFCGFCGFANYSDYDAYSFHNSDSDVYSVRSDSSDCEEEEDKNDTSRKTDQKPHVTFVIDKDSSSTKTNLSDNEQPQEDSLQNNGQTQGTNPQDPGNDALDEPTFSIHGEK